MCFPRESCRHWGWAAAPAYQSQTETDVVTGEKKVAAEKWGEEEIFKIKSIADSPPTNCDPSYPAVYIEKYPPDLDCNDIRYSDFIVMGNDPHEFNTDNNGIGCES